MTADPLDALLAPRIVGPRPPKIVTLDIERMKGQAVIEFWDLGDFKNRRIHPSDVTLWPRTICLAWRWYGAKKTGFAAEWESGREAMLKAAWDLYDQADIVVGHNIIGFDTKKLAAEWMTLGFPKPSPWKSVDTLKAARAAAGFESNTLDALLTRLGAAGKTDRYDVEVARAALEGDRAAQRKLRAYNVGDIAASEKLYDIVRPWLTNHPHIGLWSGDEDCCGNCGGELKASGWARTAVTAYAQYRCENCYAWFRRNDVKTRTRTRPAR